MKVLVAMITALLSLGAAAEINQCQTLDIKRIAYYLESVPAKNTSDELLELAVDLFTNPTTECSRLKIAMEAQGVDTRTFILSNGDVELEIKTVNQLFNPQYNSVSVTKR